MTPSKGEGGHLFAGLLVASIVYAAMYSLSFRNGYFHAELPLKIAISITLYKIFPERDSLGWSTRSLVIILGWSTLISVIWAAYTHLFDINQKKLDLNYESIYPLLVLFISTPLFEEKLIRHLLLDSLGVYLGRLISSFAVSCVFALAHWQFFWWAFVASLLLCFMKYKLKATSLHCAIVHGLVNIFVVLTYVI